MEMIALDLPDTLQPPYHMSRRDVERGVLPYCREHDIGVLVYGPLAHGLLTGTIRSDVEFDAADWRRSSPDFDGATLKRKLDVVERLRTLAADLGCSLPQLAIARTLAQPGVHCAIIGASTPAHLSDSVAAADVRLSSDDLDQIERILHSAVPVVGPSPEGQPERASTGSGEGRTTR